jgi:hypothetical protein
MPSSVYLSTLSSKFVTSIFAVFSVTVVMSALARRYAIKMVNFMPPQTDAMDTTQAKRRTMLRGWHIAPEGIGGRSQNLFIFATHLHVQHFEPIVPFNACTHQPGRFRRMTERDREGYCPVLSLASNTRATLNIDRCEAAAVMLHSCRSKARTLISYYVHVSAGSG